MLWIVLFACAPLQGRVEALEAHNSELEAQLAALEARLDAVEAPLQAQLELQKRRAARYAEYRERTASPDDTPPPPTPACQATEDGHYELLPGQTLAKLDVQGMPLHVIPHRGADRALDGLRISGIRRGSEADSCGFRNGDIVHAVSGHPLTSVAQAMEAYQALLQSEVYDITATRRGKTVNWKVRVAHQADE